MKFQLKVSGFIAGLTPVSDVASKAFVKDYVGVDKVNIVASDEGLRLSAFSGRLSVNCLLTNMDIDDLEYKCSESGSATINVKDLMKTLESFEPSESLVAEIRGAGVAREMVFMKSSDVEEYQTLPCYESPVNLPKKADKFLKSFSITKDVLVSAIDKIFFAVGYEERRLEYLYWVIRVKGDKIRFAAGTGGRFAVLDVEGKDIVKSNSSTINILFPKEQTPVIKSILVGMEDDRVEITESDANDGSGSPFQIVVKCGRIEFILVAMNPNVVWPSEEEFLSSKYTFKVVTRVSDWQWAGRGLIATFSDQMRKEMKPSRAQFSADLSKNIINAKTEEVMKASRKVPILDSTVDGPGKCEFACDSMYFSEISPHAEGDEFVQLEVNDSKMASGIAGKAMLVRYHASNKVADSNSLKKLNESTGASELFTIFFAKRGD